MLVSAAFIIGILLVSLTVGLVVPQLFPMVPENVAYILGGFVLGVQIFVYMAIQQSRQGRALKKHTDKQVHELRQDMLKISASVQGLAEEIKKVGSSVGQSSGKNRELVSEVKMLQTLLSQVSEKRHESAKAEKAVKEAKAGPTKKATKKTKAEEAVTKQVLSDEAVVPSVLSHEPEDILDDEEVYEIIRHALKENRIELFLQPIVMLPSRRPVHYECFSRVRNRDGDIVFPRDYMHVARQSGLAGTLDNLLLFRAMKVIRTLGDRRPNVRFFLNISRSSLYDEEFFPQFIDFMMSNIDLADRLVFELAQADIDDMDDQIEHSLLALGQRGFRFSMDQVEDMNFDLAKLAERYFNFVKIDAPVLMADTGHYHPEDLKEALSRFEMELIATKVEDEKTVVEILDHNVDYGQGFLFGEPKPPKAERGQGDE